MKPLDKATVLNNQLIYNNPDWILRLLAQAYGEEGAAKKLAEVLSASKFGSVLKNTAPLLAEARQRTLPPPPHINLNQQSLLALLKGGGK
jgi:hypothetical protein